MEIQTKDAIKVRDYYQQNPIEFFTDVLDVKPENVWEKMRAIAISVRDNKKTAVKAANSVSKTFTAGRLALWFLYCFYPSTVITTAPGNPQVEELLWREIRQAWGMAKYPLGGHVTQTKIDMQRGDLNTEKWFAYGFATKPDTATQEATRFQGYHNKNILVIFDEAAGILKPIWDAAHSLLSSGYSRFLVIGNPTLAHGDFVDCFKDSSFAKITIACMDTPNYQQGREVIPGLSGRDYVEETRKKYGGDSNYFKARCLGEIPDDDVDTLIPLSWIERAENRLPDPHYRFIKRFVTVDVNDGGDDDCVVKGWKNKHQIAEMVIKGKKVEECEPYVWRVLREIKGNAIIYDHDGIGRVMGGFLRASADKDTHIIAFEGSAEAYDKTMFFNRRAEGHWLMRDDFKENKISIPKNDYQREEICAIKTIGNSKGLIQIEKKEEIKKVIGRSPNMSDAIMMMSACFNEVPMIEKKQDKNRDYLVDEVPVGAMAA